MAKRRRFTPLQLAARHSLALGTSRAEKAHEAVIASTDHGLVSEYRAVKERMHKLAATGVSLRSIAGGRTKPRKKNPVRIAVQAARVQSVRVGADAGRAQARRTQVRAAAFALGLSLTVVGIGVFMARPAPVRV